jgi:hypothetical protein
VTARALLAVLRARLYAQRRLVVASCAGALVAGLVAPAQPAGAVFFCSLLGIALALAQSPGLHPHLDRCEQGAPLFGRELARAKALVPCVAAALSVAVFAGAQLVRGDSAAPLMFLIALGAVLSCTLVALSATIRAGAARGLYVLLAIGTSAMAYTLAVVERSVLAELAFCAIVAFLALRQYGEALARYDPI